MSLLTEIQNAAVDAHSDLGSLLRRCKLLAARLKSKPLENWLIWESNGYPREAELPKYRIWGLDLMGNFVGPGGAQLRHTPIPTTRLAEEVQDEIGMYRCRLSVATIEDMLEKNDKGKFAVGTGDLAVLCNQMYMGFTCLQTWAEFSSAHLIEVLNVVRNRILDFAIEIEKANPQGGDDLSEFATTQQTTVQNIVNNTILGPVGVVGPVQEFKLQVEVHAGDFKGLARLLRTYGVAEPDIEELAAALREDPRPQGLEALGPRVNGWVGKTITKGAMKVGTDVLASVVVKAISAYYGWG